MPQPGLYTDAEIDNLEELYLLPRRNPADKKEPNTLGREPSGEVILHLIHNIRLARAEANLRKIVAPIEPDAGLEAAWTAAMACIGENISGLTATIQNAGMGGTVQQNPLYQPMRSALDALNAQYAPLSLPNQAVLANANSSIRAVGESLTAAMEGQQGSNPLYKGCETAIASMWQYLNAGAGSAN